MLTGNAIFSIVTQPGVTLLDCTTISVLETQARGSQETMLFPAGLLPAAFAKKVTKYSRLVLDHRPGTQMNGGLGSVFRWQCRCHCPGSDAARASIQHCRQTVGTQPGTAVSVVLIQLVVTNQGCQVTKLAEQSRLRMNGDDQK